MYACCVAVACLKSGLWAELIYTVIEEYEKKKENK